MAINTSAGDLRRLLLGVGFHSGIPSIDHAMREAEIAERNAGQSLYHSASQSRDYQLVADRWLEIAAILEARQS